MSFDLAAIVPSRKRPDGLLRMLKSLRVTSVHQNWEAHIKLDEDDQESLDRQKEFKEFGNVRIWISPRFGGFDFLHVFQTSLAIASNAKWVWFLNDDCWIEGKGWDTQIMENPDAIAIYHPEIIKLGGSTYRRCTNTAFPIVQNRCWETCGSYTVPHPADTGLHNFSLKYNWPIRFLDGITAIHMRDASGMDAHRKL